MSFATFIVSAERRKFVCKQPLSSSKGVHRTDLANCRPISMLPSFSKRYKKIMHQRISKLITALAKVGVLLYKHNLLEIVRAYPLKSSKLSNSREGQGPQ